MRNISLEPSNLSTNNLSSLNRHIYPLSQPQQKIDNILNSNLIDYLNLQNSQIIQNILNQSQLLGINNNQNNKNNLEINKNIINNIHKRNNN